MFPSNIHKNLVQLDRQISVLENECKNMDVDKRKKAAVSKQTSAHRNIGKPTNLQLKSPPVRDVAKRTTANLKKVKKLSPPLSSSRVYSTSSLPSNSSKQYNVVSGSLIGNKFIKQCELNPNLHLCSCQVISNINNHCNNLKQNKVQLKCNCIDENLMSDKIKNVKNHKDKLDSSVESEILHKEVLFSNPGSTIEVTVKQKSVTDNQKAILSSKKATNRDARDGRDADNCKCQLSAKLKKPLGQKWSQILSLDTFNQMEENDIIPLNFQQNIDEKISYWSDSDKLDRPAIFGLTKKDNVTSNDQKHDIPRNKECILKKLKSENDAYYLQKNNSEGLLLQTMNNNQHAIFQLLMNELKQKPNVEDLRKKLVIENGAEIKAAEVKKVQCENNKKQAQDSGSYLASESDVLQTIQKLCDNLINEKELLSKELSAKDNVIATLKKREEEYLSLISNLKNKLEKAKESAKDSLSAMNELGNLKQKLLEQVKVSDSLKKSHVQMKEMLDKCALENDKLKTEIRIYKLEAQKHDVLMAGREAEIKRYKDEIRSFQKQISDHLASLKSNAQVIDMKKMMEAIIHQSQFITQDDLDSIMAEGRDGRESSKPNGLMHSSPTSSKTSDVNSSWKQISSIKTQEPERNLNESEDKEFFQVYGGDATESESESPGRFLGDLQGLEGLEGLHDPRLQEPAHDGKSCSTFTSIMSVDDDGNGFQAEEKALKRGANVKQVRGETSPQKVKGSIDELLKSMKLKWSEEVYGSSRGAGTIDDFLNDSQAISVSE